MPSETQNYLSHLKKSYSNLHFNESEVSENLISPHLVTLPKELLPKIKSAISAFFQMRSGQNYIDYYAPEFEKLELKTPGNYSVMMSYDFHISPAGDIKLIEVNTNAAFLILGLELYKLKGLTPTVSDFDEKAILNCFKNELSLNGKNSQNPFVKIVDENPQAQRLFLEFLVYQELFKKHGWQCEISDVTEALNGKIPDLIYNRYTDFYLQEAKAQLLKESFNNKKICFSPNPTEYLLLADKGRMIDWSNPEFFNQIDLDPQLQKEIESVLLKTKILTQENSEQIWSERKNLFFKPQTGFGSKMSYKGASISRKVFADLVSIQAVAQELAPAPEIQISENDSFKYDLRCFAYMGELQLIVARLFKGQVTNLQTPGGGFACVEFNL